MLPEPTLSRFSDTRTVKWPSIFSLIGSAFGIYKKHFNVIFPLAILILALDGVVFIVTPRAPVGVAIILQLIFIFFLSWFLLAMMHAMRSNAELISFKEALRRAWHNLFSLLMLEALEADILLGAIGLCIIGFIPLFLIFFLLVGSIATGLYPFLDPFIVITVFFLGVLWFGCAPWILIEDRAKGMEALTMSRRYEAHHARMLAWKVIALGVIAFGFEFLLSIFTFLLTGRSQGITSAILIAVHALIVWPVFIGCFYGLFEVLEQDSPAKVVRERHRGLTILALLGVPVALFFFFVVLSISGKTGAEYQHDLKIEANIDVLRNGLTLYYQSHNAYPISLSELPDTYNITDPYSGKPFTYMLEENGTDYSLCGVLSSGAPFCVQPDLGETHQQPVSSAQPFATSSAATTLHE